MPGASLTYDSCVIDYFHFFGVFYLTTLCQSHVSDSPPKDDFSYLSSNGLDDFNSSHIGSFSSLAGSKNADHGDYFEYYGTTEWVGPKGIKLIEVRHFSRIRPSTKGFC